MVALEGLGSLLTLAHGISATARAGLASASGRYSYGERMNHPGWCRSMKVSDANRGHDQ
jgi:hypothetical protein